MPRSASRAIKIIALGRGSSRQRCRRTRARYCALRPMERRRRVTRRGRTSPTRTSRANLNWSQRPPPRTSRLTQHAPTNRASPRPPRNPQRSELVSGDRCSADSDGSASGEVLAAGHHPGTVGVMDGPSSWWSAGWGDAISSRSGEIADLSQIEPNADPPALGM